MQLELLDWLVVGAYVVFAVGVGIALNRRASENVDEFFLTGRSLPWWIAGTSMVATTFAADTPLVVSEWVRTDGIWRNWLWWCFAIGGMLTVFLFARLWRRGGVMTTAELAELRYGDRGASMLRGFLGVFHAGITNTITLCWVILAARKIMEVLLGVDPDVAVASACLIALSYSLLSGLWGVVMTDMLQFVMAMVGAIWLAVLAWAAVGGAEGLLAASDGPGFNAHTLSFFPAAGDGSFVDASFWTVPFAAFAVSLGLSWWAKDGVDGGGVVVQRIAATRDERHGLLAALWFNFANYALRPWPWIVVALASLIVFPPIEVRSPVQGEVVAVESDHIVVAPFADDAPVLEAADAATRVGLAPRATVDVSWDATGAWVPVAGVAVGDHVALDSVVAATDSERAYPAMMTALLPAGLLGLVVASLLAAFMSTIDTHVNLAASFFVNDVYRRFVKPDATSGHYVAVARAACVVVLALAGVMALYADSISDLFLFFLAFLGGVGPVYVMRWMWWRVRASTEIAAMLASSVSTVVLTFADEWWGTTWSLGSLSPDGVLAPEGRLVLVVVVSAACALLSLLVTPTPDPTTLVPFYRRVRPIGAWGPVARLAPEVRPAGDGWFVVAGVLGGLALTYGAMLGLGWWLLDDTVAAAWSALVAAAGALSVFGATRRLVRDRPEPDAEPAAGS